MKVATDLNIIKQEVHYHISVVHILYLKSNNRQPRTDSIVLYVHILNMNNHMRVSHILIENLQVGTYIYILIIFDKMLKIQQRKPFLSRIILTSVFCS